ncbi:MAG: peptidoglycan DD-metalloendopeptidase family protein [Eubacteriales bacterium]|nr:peptidoglycan DD-metalloendopeptidase family protein [Eubacteriales bacterium]
MKTFLRIFAIILILATVGGIIFLLLPQDQTPTPTTIYSYVNTPASVTTPTLAPTDRPVSSPTASPDVSAPPTETATASSTAVSTPEPTPVPSPTPEPSYAAALKAGTGLLNIRTRPDSAAPVVGQIRQEEAFTVISRADGKWFLICCGNCVGYASGDYIELGPAATYTGSTAVSTPTPTPTPSPTPTPTPKPTPTPTPAPTSTAPAGQKATVSYSVGSLALRSGRSSSSSLITYIPSGEQVIVTDKSQTWYAVWYNGRSGYVYGPYLFFGEVGPNENGFYAGLNGYIWPTDSRRITSNFGTRDGKLHGGVDVGAVKRGVAGDKIYASKAGKVVVSFFGTSGSGYGGYGNVVVVEHSDGNRTLYAHMSKRLVSVGDQVEQGAVLGLMGTTGNSDGVHLHFEIRIGGSASNRIDPLTYFPGIG